MNDTPETKAAFDFFIQNVEANEIYFPFINLAQKFERERDEAKRELKLTLEQWELCLEQIAKLKNADHK
jgi:hypothetical protein